MAKDVRLRKKLPGLNKLMTSQSVQAKVYSEAKRISDRAGPKYEWVGQGKRASKRTARAYIQAREGARISDDDERGLLGAVGG